MNFDERLGALLIAELKRQGVPRKELAKELQVGYATLNTWLLGERRIKAEDWTNIAGILSLSLDGMADIVKDGGELDKYISMEDAIEAVLHNPVYAERIRDLPAIEDKIEKDIRILAQNRDRDGNIIKMAEEAGELIQALSKWKDGGDLEPVVEEMADVLIMLRIMRVECGVTPDQMWDMYERKMRRNLERLVN